MIRKYYGLTGKLIASVSADSTVLPVDAAMRAAISNTFENGEDITYLLLGSPGAYEVVRVTGVEDVYLNVDRAQEETTAKPFPLGTPIRYELVAAAVLAEMPNGNIEIDGGGIAYVNEQDPGEFEITVEAPNFQGQNGIEVFGSWPNINISYTADNACCGPSNGNGGGSSNLAVESSGILEAYLNGNLLYLGVQEPQFSGQGGIQVDGQWPYISFSLSGDAGTGSVSSVSGGAGITITGSPSVNPTVSISNTGVTAGDYGAIAVNSRGQFTRINAGFDPISNIESPNGSLSVNRTADTVEVSVAAAAIGAPGMVELVDPADPFDPTDEERAVTPAALATALGSLVIPTVAGVRNFIGEADGDYTNVISGSSLAIQLEAGEKALIHAEVTVVDLGSPLTPVAFGMAVFDATPAKIQSNRKITQNQQQMTFVIEGPINTGLVIATTPIGGATVTGYSLAIESF